MNAFALALAGHLIGDWLVQTDWQATNKSWPQLFNEAERVAIAAAAGDRRMQVADIVRGRRRRRSWRANQAHMLSYHVVLAVLLSQLWAAGEGPPLTWVLVALPISWVSHSIIDRRWPVKALLRRTGSAAFADQMWGVLAADQALHIAILALLTASVG